MITELISIAVGVLGVAYGIRTRRSLNAAKLASEQNNLQADSASLSKKDALQLLPNAVSSRFAQDDVLWAIIGAFWSTNAVLLVALGASGKWADSPSLVKVISVTGLFVSFFWLIMQAAALRRVLYYENLTTKFEDLIGVPERFRLFGKEPESSTVGTRILPRARKIMPYGPIVAILGWATGTYVAFTQ